MNIKDCMSARVNRLEQNTPIAEAAKLMERDGVEALLVSDDDRLVGVVTDRDLAIRAIAYEFNATDPISTVMSKKVLYCFEDDPIEDVAKNMAENQVHRLAVLNKDKRLVGIVSLGDLSTKADKDIAGETLYAICQPTRH